MSSWIFLKVFSDLSLCYALLGSFPTVFPHSFSCFWPPLLCGTGAAMAAWITDQGREKLRFGALLLPAAVFLLARTWFEALLLLPAVLYSVIVIIRGELALEYYSCRQNFLRGLVGIVCLYFGSYIYIYVDSLSDRGNIPLDQQTLLCYGLLYGLSGVILLRQLRLGDGGGRRDRIRNAGQLALTAGGGCVLLVGLMVLERALRDSATSILRLAWEGFGTLIGIIGDLMRRLFTQEMKEFYEDINTTAASAATEPDYTLPLLTGEGSTVAVEKPAASSSYPWWMAVLLLAAVLVMLVVMLRTFRAQRGGAESAQTLEKAEPGRQEKRNAPRSNRGKVRRYYREFLRSERRRGMKLRTDQTSEDILNQVSGKTDRTAAARLRQVYLRARYDEKSELTADEVQTAKNALKKARE